MSNIILIHPASTLPEVPTCGVFDAFDGLVDPCGVGLEFGLHCVRRFISKQLK
ncbi:hypothetical protein [Marinomonas primoryensis]|uniref:Uncharacterized protein n=1 Tax=Marinomonas primoryensis TaxID=178399 RepID=A0ABV0L4T9_9GAMM